MESWDHYGHGTVSVSLTTMVFRLPQYCMLFDHSLCPVVLVCEITTNFNLNNFVTNDETSEGCQQLSADV